MHIAAETGSAKILKLLMKAGADINAQNEVSLTILNPVLESLSHSVVLS